MTHITWLRLTDQQLEPGDIESLADPNLHNHDTPWIFVPNYELGHPASRIRADRLLLARKRNVVRRSTRRNNPDILIGEAADEHQTPYFWRPIKLTKTETKLDTFAVGDRRIELTL